MKSYATAASNIYYTGKYLPDQVIMVCITHYLRNRSALSSELLSNNSLFGGQLQRSNHEYVARVIYLRTTY